MIRPASGVVWFSVVAASASTQEISKEAAVAN